MVLQTAISLYVQLVPRHVLDLLLLPSLTDFTYLPDTSEHQLLLVDSVSTAFWVCVGLLLIWHQVITPAIPQYESRTKTDRIFLANSFVSLFNAFTAPVLAVLGMLRLPWGDLEHNMSSAPGAHAIRAVGLSCGYMLYDTLYCAYYREMRSPLMLAHHVLPVLFWPYCVLNNRALPVVLFFVLTEVRNQLHAILNIPLAKPHSSALLLLRFACDMRTHEFVTLIQATNIGQHSRILLERLDLKQSRIYAIVGKSWVAIFFIMCAASRPRYFQRCSFLTCTLHFGCTQSHCPLSLLVL